MAGEAGETPPAVPLSRRSTGDADILAVNLKATPLDLKPCLPLRFLLFDRDKYLRQAPEPLESLISLFGRKIWTMVVEDSVARPSLGLWSHSGHSESRSPLSQGSGRNGAA